MRPRSQSTGSAILKSDKISRSEAIDLISATTCSRTGVSGSLASRFRSQSVTQSTSREVEQIGYQGGGSI